MRISIIHPSRNRPEQAYNTAINWLNKAYYKANIQYILSLDEDEPLLKEYDKFFMNNMPGLVDTLGCVHKNKSAIEAINNACPHVNGDLLIVISDDFDCPLNWDRLLLEALEGKSDFLVKTQDGLQKTLITLPIMDREYYERFGYIYHPDYLHMHCDEEMTIVGHMLGRVITLDLLFHHNHYTTGKMAMDAINVKNNSTWGHGQATLDRRAKDNFGIANPLIKREEIIWR